MENILIEILQELKKINNVLCIIASNTEQRVNFNPLSRFEGMSLEEIETYFQKLGERYSNQ